MSKNSIKTLSCLLFFVIPIMVAGQERFLETVFDSVEVQTFTYATKNGQNLGFPEIVQFCNDYVIRKTGTIKQTIIPGNQYQCDHEHFTFCNP